jgi:peptide/nickel transport system permease protein
MSISQDWPWSGAWARCPTWACWPTRRSTGPGRADRALCAGRGVLFEEDAELEADLVVYGRVHGLAGTDHQRRDLMVALLWGTPVALAFGLLAAVGTTITTLVIAAAGRLVRGWVDATIQRLTEVNMILPLLPILVMVGTLYSTSIWLMLGVVIALGIFSAGIKMYRAMLLPIREAPYIEAARAYGAGNRASSCAT